ncbi:MAG: alkaline phosphatase D family protein [Pirellulales bacterium]
MSKLLLSCVLAIFVPFLSVFPAFSQGSKYGQFAPQDAYRDGSPLAYYGSENEWSRRQFSQDKADKDYKRRGQRQLLAILDGDPRRAIELSKSRLAADPNDLESLFTQTIAWCQLDNLNHAMVTMQQALDAGLPCERFLAGPRESLRPLLATKAFQDIVARQSIRLIHGPMLGCITDTSAKVWVRTVGEEPVTVKVFAGNSQGLPTDPVVQSAVSTPRAEEDFTAIVELTGLKPEQTYRYDVLIGGKSVLKDELPQLKMGPSKGTPTKVKIAFGGGAGFNPHLERMWDTIANYEPDALFLLGDNVYIDLPEEPKGLHRYTYHRRQSRPEFRRLVGSTAVYAIWDDHDCAIDDVWMGPHIDQPSWKQPMLAVFKENWINPSYGNQQAPGCWFEKSIGNIDFFFLDTRNYRTNPFGQNPTMLGPEQKAWFLNAIKSSQAEFKVLISSVPWAAAAKPGSRDTWDGFQAEREEIFSTLEENKIDGVLLLSADRHRSDAWKIKRTGGYALYDMMSSKLTNAHTHECFPDALFCYNDGCSFGLLTIDTTKDDATAKFEVVDIEGQVVHSLPLCKSQLRH